MSGVAFMRGSTVCMHVCVCVYVCMYVCVGPGGKVVWVLGSWSMGHGFESHHSQMNIDHSSSPASHHPHRSTQL